jgi:hypothetical protein
MVIRLSITKNMVEFCNYSRVIMFDCNRVILRNCNRFI